MPGPKFFITHSWKDIAFARKLCDDLHKNGLSGFLDDYSIQPGDDIAGRIGKGLEECDVYVPLLSPVAVASKWCELEINTAMNLSMDPERNGRPRIIPVMIEPCKLPTLLRGKLYISFVGWENESLYKDRVRDLLVKGFRTVNQAYPAHNNAASEQTIQTTIQTTAVREAPTWCARVPGSVAKHLTVAELNGRHVLIVPWRHMPQGRNARSANGGISILNVKDGSVIFERSVGAPIRGGAAIPESEKLIVFGTIKHDFPDAKGEVIVLDLQTCQERWRYPLDGSVRCMPALDTGRAFVSVGDGMLHCLDIPNRKELWRTRVCEQPALAPASPVLVREQDSIRAIIASTYSGSFDPTDGKIVAVEHQGGQVLWNRTVGGNIHGTPTLAEGRLYVTAFRDSPSVGVLSAFDAYTGHPVWAQPFVVQGHNGDHFYNNLSASPLVQGGKIYVGSLNHLLYALDAAKGNVLWQSEVGGGIATTTVLLLGMVVFGANDGNVYILETETGRIVSKYPLSAPVRTDPLVLQQTIFVGADNGTVAALPCPTEARA